MTRPTPEFDVPDGETPAASCPYCDRPFTSQRLRDIHVGDVHPERCTADQRAAYEAAVDAEGDDLFVYHLTVIGALVALYATMIFTYMGVLGAQAG